MVYIKKFDFTREGSREAHKYLINVDRIKDFWFGCSAQDVINHANKVWKELNPEKTEK